MASANLVQGPSCSGGDSGDTKFIDMTKIQQWERGRDAMKKSDAEQSEELEKGLANH